MPRYPTIGNLQEWEVPIIKAMCLYSDKNDQQILSYFSRPSRDVNHRLIGQIRKGTCYLEVQAASREIMLEFLENYPLLNLRNGLHLYGDELLIKAREAMMSAVQTFNDPKCYFKSETFIVLSIIAWTYLFHAYYRQQGIDYRYLDAKGIPLKTKHGAIKYWDLGRCLKAEQCILDDASKANLSFLLEIRHEIEHQMTQRIDHLISAKFQSCCLNFNTCIKDWFGPHLRLDNELSFSLQFSGIELEQEKLMRLMHDSPNKITLIQDRIEHDLDEETYKDERYALRYHLIPQVENRKGNADTVMNIVKGDDPVVGEINTILKRVEKKKFLASEIVKKMQDRGFVFFRMYEFIKLCKELNAKNPEKNFCITAF